MKDTDWAYLAGFLDADGSIAIDKTCRSKGHSWSWATKIYITNAHRDTLEWLVTALDGSIYLVNKKAPKHHSTMWRWVVHGSAAGPILFNMLPYLREKKKRAEIALRFIDTITHKGRLSEEDKQLRLYLSAQLTQMNRRGRPR